MSRILIVGGTAGIGRQLATECVARGDSVVIAGRNIERAESVAAALTAASPTQGRGSVRAIEVDLRRPHDLTTSLASVGKLDSLVLAGMERDQNTLKNYDITRATELMTVKLIGYTTVVHVLLSHISLDGSVLLFGGTAKDRPYRGSTSLSPVNAGIVGLVATLAVELAPVRVNGIHPGAVVDSPFWSGQVDILEPVRSTTLSGRLATMSDIVDGCFFLLRNPAANGVNLGLDGGFSWAGIARETHSATTNRSPQEAS